MISTPCPPTKVLITLVERNHHQKSSGYQVVHQAHDPGGRHGRYGHQGQVVGDAGCDAGGLRETGVHQVAEVVVADGLPGEPGVVGREVGAGQHSVQKREIHRLLGVGDGGSVASDDTPHHEHQREDDLRRQYYPPLPGNKGLDRSPPSPEHQQGHRQHHHEGDGHPKPAVGQNPRYAQDPEEICDQEQADRPTEGVAPIR